jgi:hypothetical protein
MSNSQRMHACGAGVRLIEWPAKLSRQRCLRQAADNGVDARHEPGHDEDRRFS